MVGSHNWYWSRLLICRGEIPYRFKSYTHRLEGTAEWPATGLENQGGVTPGRSIRLPSVITRLVQSGRGNGLKIHQVSVRIRERVFGLVAQLVEAFDSRSKMYRFESYQGYNAPVAQFGRGGRLRPCALEVRILSGVFMFLG